MAASRSYGGTGFCWGGPDGAHTASAPSGEHYYYDQPGRIWVGDGSSYTYSDSAHKHAVTAFNGASYVYDANGCMTTHATSRTIKYDPESRLVGVQSGGLTICRFAYDGDGVRRKRLDNLGTVHYVGAYERKVGNGSEVVTKYYYASLGASRRLIAFRKGGTLYYVASDHLGSTVMVTDSVFWPIDGMRYKPYGVSRNAGTNLNTDHKFTSQIEDAGIGLYWYVSPAWSRRRPPRAGDTPRFGPIVPFGRGMDTAAFQPPGLRGVLPPCPAGRGATGLGLLPGAFPLPAPGRESGG